MNASCRDVSAGTVSSATRLRQVFCLLKCIEALGQSGGKLSLNVRQVINIMSRGPISKHL